MSNYIPLDAVTNLPLTPHGHDVAYYPTDIANATIRTSDGNAISLGPYVLCKVVEGEHQTAVLERIASDVAGYTQVDAPIHTSALMRIAAALDRIVGQMEQRP